MQQKWYVEPMDRKKTALYRMSDHRNDDFVPGTPAERISLVWPLTREIASLRKKHELNEDYRDMLHALSGEKVN